MEQLKILVANDNDFQLMAATYNLSQFQNLQITETVNGLEAYQEVVKRSPDDSFDIILLDLDMPIMSGYEACRKIVEQFDSSLKLFKVEQTVQDDN